MNKGLRGGAGALMVLALLQMPHVAVAQSEAIRVHGHWTIDIREPGGALVTHREFQNALAPAGKGALVKLLGRVATAGLWRISLNGFFTQPCSGQTGNFQPCHIVELNDPFAVGHPQYFPNLTVVAGPTYMPELTLAGTATAAHAGDIKFVETGLSTCPAGTAPQPCGSSFDFTSTDLKDPISNQPAPILVTAGQIIQVKVVISFQ